MMLKLLCLIGCLGVAHGASVGACKACGVGTLANAAATAGCGACRAGGRTATCTSATVDLTCIAGNFLDSTTAAATPECKACATNCVTCTSATVCTKGVAGSYLLAGVATQCTGTAQNQATSGICFAHATLKVPKGVELCATGQLTAAPAIATAAQACQACHTAKFIGTTPPEGGADLCTACRAGAATCTSAVVDLTCNAGFFLNAAATGGATCQACTAYTDSGAATDICTGHATLKIAKLAADRCAAGNTLAASPPISAADATTACKACPAAHFPKAAATSGCTACGTGCGACTSATVCTAPLAGFFLKTTGAVVAADPCVPATTAALCTADATLKLAKVAADLCAAANALTATPDVTTAAVPGAAQKASASSTSVGAAALLIAAVAARFQ